MNTIFLVTFGLATIGGSSVEIHYNVSTRGLDMHECQVIVSGMEQSRVEKPETGPIRTLKQYCEYEAPGPSYTIKNIDGSKYRN